MIRGLKLVHFIGLVLFLGSIITFIIISSLIEGSSLSNIAFGRKIISSGTNALTLPGMWMLAITGVWMGLLRYGIRQRYFQIKLLLIVLIMLNAHFFIVPAVTTATDIATHSLDQGKRFAQYDEAYMRESVLGAVNVLLTLSAIIVGIWGIGKNHTDTVRGPR